MTVLATNQPTKQNRSDAMHRLTPEDFYRTIGKRIREEINRTGKSYSRIGKEFEAIYGEKLRPSAITRICSGDQRMFLHQTRGLCEVLGISINDLIECGESRSTKLSPILMDIIQRIGEDEAFNRLLK